MQYQEFAIFRESEPGRLLRETLATAIQLRAIRLLADRAGGAGEARWWADQVLSGDGGAGTMANRMLLAVTFHPAIADKLPVGYEDADIDRALDQLIPIFAGR